MSDNLYFKTNDEMINYVVKAFHQRLVEIDREQRQLLLNYAYGKRNIPKIERKFFFSCKDMINYKILGGV